MQNNPFQTREPSITGNPRLRTPQREAYAELAQGQDFVSAATRQHEQTDRRHCAGRYAAALARNLVQHLPQPGELGFGLPTVLGVHRDGPARMAVFRGYAPVPGKGIHVRQRLDRHVGHRRGFAEGSERQSLEDPDRSAQADRLFALAR